MVLTAKGKRTRSELLAEFHRPPSEFDALDRADLEALDRVLMKLAATQRAERQRAGAATRARPESSSRRP